MPHLGSERQEFLSPEALQPATPQREQDLLAGITLIDFPGTPAEKQEALKIFTSYVICQRWRGSWPYSDRTVMASQ